MSKFTAKQLLFIEHKAAGYSNAKAIVAAGYSEKGAAQAGSLMAKRSDVQAAIKKSKSQRNLKAAIETAVRGKPVDKDMRMPRKNYTDPMVFLTDLMNHEGMPMLMRKDAAKDLMAYKHARIGEKGKKATADDEAHAISKGKSKSKFKTQKPPTNVTPIGVAKRAHG